MASPADPAAPAPRGQIACTDCRLRKRRCDGGQPCQNCIARGIPCVYEPMKKRGPRLGKRREPKVAGETKGCCQHEEEEAPAAKVPRLDPASASASASPASPASPSPSPSHGGTPAASLFHLPPSVSELYHRYIWAFFTGPGACLPLVKQDVFAQAAHVAFERAFFSDPEVLENPHSRCTQDEGKCCQPTKGGEYSSDCCCFQAAQGGLVWGVLSLGAQMCGDPLEAANFIVAARESLMKSLYCAGEVTAQAFFILSQYYYGMGDSHQAFKVIKKGLDITNKIPNPTPGLRALCDFLCLLFYLPATPDSTTPLKISSEAWDQLQQLRLEPGQTGFSTFPTTENAQVACLKLLGEAAGHLSNVERFHQTFPTLITVKQVLQLVNRNLDLCRRIHEVWQPFGAMNTLMASVYDSVFLWALRCREKLVLEEEKKRKPLGQEPPVDLTQFDENVCHFLSFLHRLPQPAATQHDSQAAEGCLPKLTTGSLVATIPSHPRRKLIPVFLFSLVYNGSSLMSEWEMKADLARMTGYLKEMGQVWPMLSVPSERLEMTLLHHHHKGSDNEPPIETHKCCASKEQAGNNEPADDFITSFWTSSSNDITVSEFLRDLGLPNIDDDGNGLERESFFL